MTARQLLRTCAYGMAGRESVLAAVRWARLRGKIVVLMYHEVAEDGAGLDSWTVVRRSDFERQMDYVQTHFRVLRLKEALQMMDGEGCDDPCCVVTFDDGYAGNRDVLLPLAVARGLPVTVFVATAAVEEQRLYWYDQLVAAWEDALPHDIDLRRHGLDVYGVNCGAGAARWAEKNRLLRDLKGLAPGQRTAVVEEILSTGPPAPEGTCRRIAPLTIRAVQELAATEVVEIGAHTHGHEILTQLPEPEIRRSVGRSKELLEAWTGRPVVHFSYPNGNHSAVVSRAVRELGFTCGLTTSARPWSREDAPFSLPRIGIGRYDTFPLFKARVSGACRYARD